MGDPRVQLDGLATRLEDAATRLKAATDPPPEAGASPYGDPPAPELDAHGAADVAGEPNSGMAAVLQRLEAAGAAVRDARLRLAELQSKLDAF